MAKTLVLLITAVVAIVAVLVALWQYNSNTLRGSSECDRFTNFQLWQFYGQAAALRVLNVSVEQFLYLSTNKGKSQGAVAPRNIVFLYGPTASGKSTLATSTILALVNARADLCFKVWRLKVPQSISDWLEQVNHTIVSSFSDKLVLVVFDEFDILLKPQYEEMLLKITADLKLISQENHNMLFFLIAEIPMQIHVDDLLNTTLENPSCRIESETIGKALVKIYSRRLINQLSKVHVQAGFLNRLVFAPFRLLLRHERISIYSDLINAQIGSNLTVNVNIPRLAENLADALPYANQASEYKQEIIAELIMSKRLLEIKPPESELEKTIQYLLARNSELTDADCQSILPPLEPQCLQLMPTISFLDSTLIIVASLFFILSLLRCYHWSILQYTVALALYVLVWCSVLFVQQPTILNQCDFDLKLAWNKHVCQQWLATPLDDIGGFYKSCSQFYKLITVIDTFYQYPNSWELKRLAFIFSQKFSITDQHPIALVLFASGWLSILVFIGVCSIRGSIFKTKTMALFSNFVQKIRGLIISKHDTDPTSKSFTKDVKKTSNIQNSNDTNNIVSESNDNNNDKDNSIAVKKPNIANPTNNTTSSSTANTTTTTTTTSSVNNLINNENDKGVHPPLSPSTFYLETIKPEDTSSKQEKEAQIPKEKLPEMDMKTIGEPTSDPTPEPAPTPTPVPEPTPTLEPAPTSAPTHEPEQERGPKSKPELEQLEKKATQEKDKTEQQNRSDNSMDNEEQRPQE